MNVFLLILLSMVAGAVLVVMALFCFRKYPWLYIKLLHLLRQLGVGQLLGHERALIDSVQDLIWLKDLKGRYVSVNRAFLENYRKSRREVEGRTDRELFSPALAELYSTQDKQVFTQGTSLRVEEKIGEDADLLWYETILIPLRDRHGRLTGLSGVSRNITQRKLDLHRLDEFHDRLTLAIHAGKFGVWDWDITSDRLIWDDQMYALYGLRHDNFAGAFQAWASSVVDEDKDAALAEVQAALKGEREFSTQFRVRWPDGSIHHLRGIGMVQRDARGVPLRMIGMNWDVTEQNEAVHALQLRERELDAIFENIPNMVFVKDAQTLRFLRFNKAGEELLGLPRERLVDHGDYDVFPPEQAEFCIMEDRKAIARGGVTDVPEENLDTPQGRRILHTRKVCVRDAQGNPRYLIGISEDITARKEVEQQQRRLLEILDSATDLIALADKQGQLIYINDAGRRMLGLGAEEPLSDAHLRDMYAPAVGRHVIDDLLPQADSQGYVDFETHLLPKSGKVFAVSQVIVVHRDPDGAVTHYSTIARDVSEYKQLIEHYMLSDKVFTFTGEAIMITNGKNRILSVNEAFTKLTGYSLPEVKGKDPKILAAGTHDKGFYAAMWREIDRFGHWEGEIWDRRKDGSIYPKWLSINAVKEAGRDQVSHYIGIFSDISQRKEQEGSIRYLAFHDALTGLPNRSLFQDRLHQAVAESRREGLPMALMLLDLDHFKYVNDTLGHHNGDLLLQEVALRLAASVRESDTVARLGGDEFVIIVHGIHDLGDVVPVAEKIFSEVARPMQIGGHEFHVTSSLGIALYPDDAANIDDLIRNADTAMYHAKDKGRDNYQFFTSRMNEAAHERVLIEEHLRKGLENGEFELFYQPKVGLNPRQLVGCEALLRWRHPEWGLILPTRFIPVAEDSGLILPLGEWVIDEACRQVRQWIAAGLKLQVAVNLSGRQFHDVNLIAKIRKALGEDGARNRWIELEITESTLIEGASHAARTLHELYEMALPLAVDDFGTGYSSLAYLKTFAIDTLKIDKSFIDGIGFDPNDATIVRAVISLAHQLGIKVVAEGVEEERQLRFLEELYCDIIQGHYFSEPLGAEDFIDYVRRDFPQAFTSAQI